MNSDKLRTIARDLRELADELDDEDVTILHTPGDPVAILRDLADELTELAR